MSSPFTKVALTLGGATAGFTGAMLAVLAFSARLPTHLLWGAIITILVGLAAVFGLLLLDELDHDDPNEEMSNGYSDPPHRSPRSDA